MPNQLIYRQARCSTFNLVLPPGVRFAFCTGLADGLRITTVLCKRLGAVGAAKDLLKLMTPCRRYACLLDGHRIVSECYVTLSRCKHYAVEPGAAVLGPVWTDPQRRGKGLGTFLLKATLNRLVQDGCRIFYIDTSEQNIAMQKVIASCGFPNPIARLPKRTPVYSGE